MADVADRPFARREIERLAAGHRDACTDLAFADLAVGRTREGVAALRALLDERPEGRLSQALAVALYRNGQTAEAAEACRIGLGRAAELGIDDLPLRSLQSDILRGAPSSDSSVLRLAG